MKKKAWFIALFSFIAMAITFLGFTISWFVPLASINIEGQADTLGAYFAYGNGKPYNEETGDRPYGITKPRHLYNLSWLQYLNSFNGVKQQDENGNIIPTYFELGSDVDGDGLIIPPIGNEDTPFVGNFDGKGYVISNITITNDADNFVKKPGAVSKAEFNEDKPEIVGLFGVVGKLESDTKTKYNSQTNEIKNMGISNVTIQSETPKTLIGIAAGYVNGTINDVAINNCSVDITQSNSQKVDVSGVNNISDYTVVGYCTENFKTNVKDYENQVYGVNVKEEELVVREDGLNENKNGGSINMTNLYNRIKKAKGTTISSSIYRQDAVYDLDGKTITNTRNVISSAEGDYYGGAYLNKSDNKLGVYNVGYYYNQKYQCIIGGVLENSYYTEYNNHSGRYITDGTNYLSCNSFTTNTNNQIVNTDMESAIVWNLPSTSGSISYTYRTLNQFNYTDTIYYLCAENNNLFVRNGNNYATVWVKEIDSNNNVRFKTSLNGLDYYLNFTNGKWGLTAIPQPPSEPEAPIVPQMPNAPLDPELNEPTIEEPNRADYVYYTYSMHFLLDNNTRYVEPNARNNGLTNSTSIFDERQFSSALVNGGTTKIYYKSGGDTYYLNTKNKRFTIGQSEANATVWTLTSSGNGWKFSDGNYYIHLTSYYGYYYYLELSTTDDNNVIIVTPYEKVLDEYNQLLEEYNDAWDDYKASKEEWDTYRSALNNYENVLLPAYERALDNYNNVLIPEYNTKYEQYEADLAATYKLENTQTITKKGTDIAFKSNSPVKHMVYTGDNTCYFPLNVVDDGTQSDLTKYYPTANNTGYMIGGSAAKKLDGQTENIDLTEASTTRISSYPISNISFSYQNKTMKNIYTINEDNEIQKVGPGYYDGYSEFENTLPKLKTILDKDTSNVYGLHYVEAEVGLNHLVRPNYAYVNGVEYNVSSTDNYQLPVNTIDFSLKEKGFINFFAGMYYPANDAMFSLFQIRRNSDNSIAAIKEVAEVLSDGNENHSYVYKFTDGQYSVPFITEANGTKKTMNNETYNEEVSLDGGTQAPDGFTNVLFNTNRITNYNGDTRINDDFWWPGANNNTPGSNSKTPKTVKDADNNNVTVNQAIYYFEIPMNQGEFALGSTSHGYGGYLFYLDIGANAKKINRTTFTEHFKEKQTIYTIPKGLSLIEFASQNIDVDENNSACLALSVGSKGKMYVSRIGNKVVAYEESGVVASGVYKPRDLLLVKGSLTRTADPPNETLVESNTEIKVFGAETVRETWRMQYYDVNVAKNEIIKTIISDVYINDVAQGRVIKQYDTNEQEIPTADIPKVVIYDKDGNVVKDHSTINIVKTYSENANVMVSYTFFLEGDEELTKVIEYLLTAKDIKDSAYKTFGDYQVTITITEGGDTIITILARGTGSITINGFTVPDKDGTIEI